MADVTGLGRRVDPRLPSNRLAIGGTVGSGLVVALRDLLSSGSIDAMAAISTAVAVFLAWAIGRELDPDDPRSATLAMGITLAFALFTGVEAFGAAVGLLGLRLLVGSVGRPLKPGDYAVLVVAAGLGGTRPELWPLSALILVALVVAKPRHFGVAALGATIATFTGAFLWSPPLTLTWSWATMAIASFAVLAALAGMPTANITSLTDSGDEGIDLGRVALARVATGAIVALTTLIVPGTFPTVAPLLGALVSVAILETISNGVRDARTVPAIPPTPL